MNRYKKKLIGAMQFCSITLLTLFVLVAAKAQSSVTATANHDRSAARSALVRVSSFRHWFTSSDLRPLPANSTRPAIERGSPASPDALAAMVETTLGGLKFPNGTLQPTAAGGLALKSVIHDDTLQGDGTSESPLGIKVPLTLDGALTVNGDIQSNNIRSGNSLLIGSSTVRGALVVGGVIRGTPAAGNAVEATGGVGEFGNGAAGVNAHGGNSDNQIGGAGVQSFGGNSDSIGGDGIKGFGGNSNRAEGGAGVLAIGGRTNSFQGGIGVLAVGGGADEGTGGAGIDVTGGSAIGSHVSGVGIIARPGTGFDGAERGFAGIFDGKVAVNGDLQVRGNLSKGGGSFKIDHPLDPANKYLYHSFVESPDMKNIYDGVAQLDTKGEAIVVLPDWFSALNRDFRYLLTPIGAPAPNLFIAEKIADNRFKIAGGQSGLEVSWQVTGIRQDAYANKNRILVEEDKPAQERGFLLHPDAFNQPEEKNVLMEQHPEIMRQTKETPDKIRKEKLL